MLKHSVYRSLVGTALTCLLLAFSLPTHAEPDQEKPSAEAKAKKEAKKKKSDKKSIQDIVKKSALTDGLFKIYQDKKTGETRILVNTDQLDTDFLYFTYVEDGVAAAGWGRTRGSYNTWAAKLFRFHRHYTRLELVAYNTHYYFDPDTAISRAANANIPPAILFSQEIEAVDKETGDILIIADKLFRTEALYPLKPIPKNKKNKPSDSFNLGKLSKEKTKIRKIRNYPENTDIIVEYVYNNGAPKNSGGTEVTDPRYVSLVAQHTFIKAPKAIMSPRYDDPRIGYFAH